MLILKSPFTAAVIAMRDNPYSITDLGVEVLRPEGCRLPEQTSILRGLSFPVSADKTLVRAAEKLVTALNQVHMLWEKEGEAPYGAYGSLFLRTLLVKSTAALAVGFADFSGTINDQRDEVIEKRAHDMFSHVRLAYDLKRVMDALEDNSDPVLQWLGDDLREFVEIFACTEGASPYTIFALFNNPSVNEADLSLDGDNDIWAELEADRAKTKGTVADKKIAHRYGIC